MTRFTHLLRLVVVAGLLSVPACGSKSNSQGKGGASGGGAGIGGASGAGGGAGAGTGDASGGGGGGSTTCPSPRPSIGDTCTFKNYCPYVDVCRCGECCSAVLGCTDGVVVQIEYSGTCFGATCDGGAGGGGGTAISSCPASRPSPGAACTGTFTCDYNDLCRCGVCCTTSYGCTNGGIALRGSTDACYNIPCDAGTATGTGGSAGGAVCTFGADQTCNDNPIWSSIHGHCTDAGACACNGDAGTNPDSGHCL